MQYEFHVLLKHDDYYFTTNSGGDATLDLNQHGEAGWQIAGVTPMKDGGFAIILQRPVE